MVRWRPDLSTRTRRSLRRGILIAALCLFAYELAFNAFLLTGALGRTLSSNPATLLVQYSAGWSLWPGRVHARGLRIRSRDSNVEFDLRIDQCVFDFAPFALARRKFHVLRIDGQGVAFRARRRLDPADADARTVDALPPIDGLERVPLRGPETPPPDDAHYKLVTVELDRVDARSTREIWVDRFRYVGDARLTGGFYLRPVRWVTVGPAVAELIDGRLTTGDDVIASPLRGSLTVTVDGFDPRLIDGGGVLARTSVRARLNAVIPGAQFVRRFIADDGVRIGGGSGDADLELRLEHGRIIGPSRAHLDARRLRLDANRCTAEADVRALATVDGDGAESRLIAGLTASKIRAVWRSEPSAPLVAENIELRAASSRLDLSDRPLSDAAVSAQAPRIDIPDASLANAWLPPGDTLHVDSGRGTAGGQAELEGGVAHGRAVLGLDHVRVRAGGASLSGALRAHVVLRGGDVGAGTLDLGGSGVDLTDVDAEGEDLGPHFWARAALSSGTLSTRHGLSFHSRVEASALDSRPIVSLARKLGGVPPWAAALLPTGELRASADLRVRSGLIDLHDLVVTAGSLRIDGDWSKHGRANRLLLLVDTPAITVGVETRDSHTGIQVVGARDWFRRTLSQP